MKCRRHSRQPAVTSASILVQSLPLGLCCFVDGAFSSGLGVAAFGMVLCDANGTFFVAKNGPLPHCSDSYLADMMACREALS